jgi:hypothetical protein
MSEWVAETNTCDGGRLRPSTAREELAYKYGTHVPEYVSERACRLYVNMMRGVRALRVSHVDRSRAAMDRDRAWSEYVQTCAPPPMDGYAGAELAFAMWHGAAA